MKTSATELASRISRALISASKHTRPTRTWTPSLEQTLHGLGCRDSLTPPLVARVIDPFLLTHQSLALGFFNWASQQPGFSHTSLTYQSVLKSLSLSRQFSAIDALLKQVRAQKINLSSSAYGSLIASLIIGKKTHNAFLVFSEVSSLVQEIDPEICNSLLAALASDGYLEYAEQVFEKMVLGCVPLSTLGFGVFIWRFSRNGEVDRVLCMSDEVRRGTSQINGSIIAVLIVHGLCQTSRVSEAYSVLDELRIRGCKPDFMAYRTVTEGFRAMGSVVDTEKVLKKKRKLGVAPRDSDYREFILALVSERRMWEAKELGELIVSGNFPMQDDVLNVLIGSVSATDPDSAIMFFKFMVGKERFPTLLTYSNLSRNLCKHGKTDELLEVSHILSFHGYFKDLESYNMMVSFLCKAGKVREAYGVLQEMKRKGLGPDVSSYNTVMEGCCREGLLRPAKKLWDEMFASGCGGNLKTYNILIQKFSEIGQVEEAERLFCHMLEKGVAPDGTTYTCLLGGLCHEKKIEAAFDVFNQCAKQDVVLARTILGSFVLFLCKEGHFAAASKLLCDLICDIAHSGSHVILLKYLADAGEDRAAIEHIEQVGKASPSTLQVVFNELLALLSSSSKPEPISKLLQAMREISSSQHQQYLEATDKSPIPILAD